jgi:Fe2+ or Zn2+ uptake regulation protein
MSNELSERQERILSILSNQSHKSFKAYDLLREMKTTPPLIYRDLDKLIRLNLAYKVKSINAFMYLPRENDDFIVITICTECNVLKITTLDDSQRFQLAEIVGDDQFYMNNVVEVMGTCGGCEVI